MLQISMPTVPNAVVVLILVSAIGASTRIDNALAEDCLAGPDVSTPSGQHWYYRLDHVKHRRCWFLHAPLRISRRDAHSLSKISTDATIQHPAASVPIPPPNDALTPASLADSFQRQPITALTVKTISVPAVSMREQGQPEHGADEPPVAKAVVREYRAAQAGESRPTAFFLLVPGLGIAAFLTIIIWRAAGHRALVKSQFQFDA